MFRITSNHAFTLEVRQSTIIKHVLFDIPFLQLSIQADGPKILTFGVPLDHASLTELNSDTPHFVNLHVIPPYSSSQPDKEYDFTGIITQRFLDVNKQLYTFVAVDPIYIIQNTVIAYKPEIWGTTKFTNQKRGFLIQELLNKNCTSIATTANDRMANYQYPNITLSSTRS